MITFHPEASDHVDRSLALIKSSGAKCGLVLNPATPLSVLDYTLEGLDMVLVMSINPALVVKLFTDDLPEDRGDWQRIDVVNPAIRLEVDGGVKIDNIGAIKAAGAIPLLLAPPYSEPRITALSLARCVRP